MREVGLTLTLAAAGCSSARRPGSAGAVLPALRRSPGPAAAPQGSGWHLRFDGYVAALGDQGPVRGAQNVFVNRRIVKDRTIAHAIIEAYSVATIKERSPEVHLFIEIPPDRVDVNVHPTKAEVRFPRAVTGARSPAPRARRGARAGPRPRVAALDRCQARRDEPQPMSIPGVLAGADVGNRWSRGWDRRSADPVRGSVVPGRGRWPRQPWSHLRQAKPHADWVERRHPANARRDIRPMIPLGPVSRHLHHRHRRRRDRDHRSARGARACAVRAGDGAS